MDLIGAVVRAGGIGTLGVLFYLASQAVMRVDMGGWPLALQAAWLMMHFAAAAGIILAISSQTRRR